MPWSSTEVQDHWVHGRPAEPEAACEQDPRWNECTLESEKPWPKAPKALPQSTTSLRTQAPLHLSYACQGYNEEIKQGNSSQKGWAWMERQRKQLKCTSVEMPSVPARAKPTGTPTCNLGSRHKVVVFCYEALATMSGRQMKYNRKNAFQKSKIEIFKVVRYSFKAFI